MLEKAYEELLMKLISKVAAAVTAVAKNILVIAVGLILISLTIAPLLILKVFK